MTYSYLPEHLQNSTDQHELLAEVAKRQAEYAGHLYHLAELMNQAVMVANGELQAITASLPHTYYYGSLTAAQSITTLSQLKTDIAIGFSICTTDAKFIGELYTQLCLCVSFPEVITYADKAADMDGVSKNYLETYDHYSVILDKVIAALELARPQSLTNVRTQVSGLLGIFVTVCPSSINKMRALAALQLTLSRLNSKL